MLSIQEIQNYSHQSGSSMVSLLIPPETNVYKLRSRMINEIGTSQNIKDKNNRVSVSNALSKITEYLKNINTVPDTGIAIYSEQYI